MVIHEELRLRGFSIRIPTVIMLGIASSKLVSLWIYNPQALESAHVRSLDHYCALPPHTLQRMRKELQSRHFGSVCSILHPNQTCGSFYFMDMMPKLLIRAATVYIPLHLLGQAMKYKKWIYGPVPSPYQISVGFIRSCLFLSSFYMIPMATACTCTVINDQQTRIRLAGAMGALSALFESPERQRSVSTIVWTYTLVGSIREKRGMSPIPIPSTLVDALVFTLSIVAIFRRIELQNTRIVNALYGYPKLGERKGL